MRFVVVSWPHEEELKEAQDLFLCQPLAVHLGFDEPGQEIVPRRRPPLLDEALEVRLHLAVHLGERAERLVCPLAPGVA